MRIKLQKKTTLEYVLITILIPASFVGYFTFFAWIYFDITFWVRFQFLLPAALSLLLLVFAKNLSFHPIAVLAIFIALFSTLQGLIFKWLFVDIAADTLRVVLPFLLFTGVLSFLARKDNTSIYLRSLIKIAIVFQLIILSVSVVYKSLAVLNGAPIIQYAINPIVIPLLLLCITTMNVLDWGKWRYFLIFLGFATPIFTLSKTMFIVNFFLLLLLLFFIKKKYSISVIVIFVISIIFLIYNSSFDIDDFSILQRFSIFAETTFQGGDSDGSSGGRMAEALNAMHQLKTELPFSLLLGLGSGAQWFDTLGLLNAIDESLASGNFRQGGGAHHIHLTYIAILFRYGLAGLCLFGLYIYISFRSAWVSYHSYDKKSFEGKLSLALLFYFFASFIQSLFTYAIYDSFEYAIFAAVACALAHSRKASTPRSYSSSRLA